MRFILFMSSSKPFATASSIHYNYSTWKNLCLLSISLQPLLFIRGYLSMVTLNCFYHSSSQERNVWNNVVVRKSEFSVIHFILCKVNNMSGRRGAGRPDISAYHSLLSSLTDSELRKYRKYQITTCFGSQHKASISFTGHNRHLQCHPNIGSKMETPSKWIPP